MLTLFNYQTIKTVSLHTQLASSAYFQMHFMYFIVSKSDGLYIDQ